MPSATTWRKIQAVSGLSFAVYLIIHLLAHSSNVISQEFGNVTLGVARSVYRNALFESLLAASAFIHMASNAVLYLNRRKIEASVKTKTMDGEPKSASKPSVGNTELQAHRYTGYLLSFLIVGHVWGVRGAPAAALGLEASNVLNYTYVYLATKGFGNWFAFYLIFFGLAGLWHMIYGVRMALATMRGRSVHRTHFPKSLTMFALAMGILLINGVVAMVGWHHYTVTITEEQVSLQDIIDNYVPPMILFFRKAEV